MTIKSLMAAILFLFLLPFVIGDHEVSVSFGLNEMSVEEVKSITLNVTNSKTSKHNIVKIELNIPTDAKNVTVFDVKNVFELPVGWQSTVMISEGKLSKIIFNALDGGVRPGMSKSFVLSSVAAPKSIGSYQFEWKTTDSVGDTKNGTVSVAVKLGPLTGFIISRVPKEVVVGETFNTTIIAYSSSDIVKIDYVGIVSFKSTDLKAKFNPSTYKFQKADNGRKQISVTFNTPGSHTFTVVDLQTGINATSELIEVKPAVPRRLSVNINEGARETYNPLVTLSIEVIDAKECRYSNDMIFWSEYQPYVGKKEWKLDPWEGEKTVYVQCRNIYGESEVASDTILLKEPFAWSLNSILSIVALILSILALIVAVRKKEREEEESS